MADEAEPVVDETTPPEPETEEGKVEEAKPGTPDKALQKMQQELGNVTRQLAALQEKKDADGPLSDADKAKMAKAEQRLTAIRQFVDDPIAEEVLDLTEKVGEQDSLKKELKETRERLALLESDRNWERARTKYAGLDVDAIWEKASKDAAETLGDDLTTRAHSRLASKWFEERCEAAKKRMKEDPAAKKEVATAPSTYKVGSAQKTAPVLSDEDDALAMARQLIIEI